MEEAVALAGRVVCYAPVAAAIELLQSAQVPLGSLQALTSLSVAIAI